MFTMKGLGKQIVSQILIPIYLFQALYLSLPNVANASAAIDINAPAGSGQYTLGNAAANSSKTFATSAMRTGTSMVTFIAVTFAMKCLYVNEYTVEECVGQFTDMMTNYQALGIIGANIGLATASAKMVARWTASPIARSGITAIFMQLANAGLTVWMNHKQDIGPIMDELNKLLEKQSRLERLQKEALTIINPVVVQKVEFGIESEETNYNFKPDLALNASPEIKANFQEYFKNIKPELEKGKDAVKKHLTEIRARIELLKSEEASAQEKNAKVINQVAEEKKIPDPAAIVAQMKQEDAANIKKLETNTDALEKIVTEAKGTEKEWAEYLIYLKAKVSSVGIEIKSLETKNLSMYQYLMSDQRTQDQLKAMGWSLGIGFGAGLGLTAVTFVLAGSGPPGWVGLLVMGTVIVVANAILEKKYAKERIENMYIDVKAAIEHLRIQAAEMQNQPFDRIANEFQSMSIKFQEAIDKFMTEMNHEIATEYLPELASISEKNIKYNKIYDDTTRKIYHYDLYRRLKFLKIPMGCLVKSACIPIAIERLKKNFYQEFLLDRMLLPSLVGKATELGFFRSEDVTASAAWKFGVWTVKDASNVQKEDISPLELERKLLAEAKKATTDREEAESDARNTIKEFERRLAKLRKKIEDFKNGPGEGLIKLRGDLVKTLSVILTRLLEGAAADPLNIEKKAIFLASRRFADLPLGTQQLAMTSEDVQKNSENNDVERAEDFYFAEINKAYVNQLEEIWEEIRESGATRSKYQTAIFDVMEMMKAALSLDPFLKIDFTKLSPEVPVNFNGVPIQKYYDIEKKQYREFFERKIEPSKAPEPPKVEPVVTPAPAAAKAQDKQPTPSITNEPGQDDESCSEENDDSCREQDNEVMP